MDENVIGCTMDGIFGSCVECGLDNQSLECAGLMDKNNGEYVYN